MQGGWDGIEYREDEEKKEEDYLGHGEVSFVLFVCVVMSCVCHIVLLSLS